MTGVLVCFGCFGFHHPQILGLSSCGSLRLFLVTCWWLLLKLFWDKKPRRASKPCVRIRRRRSLKLSRPGSRVTGASGHWDLWAGTEVLITDGFLFQLLPGFFPWIWRLTVSTGAKRFAVMAWLPGIPIPSYSYADGQIVGSVGLLNWTNSVRPWKGPCSNWVWTRSSSTACLKPWPRKRPSEVPKRGPTGLPEVPVEPGSCGDDSK